MAGQPLPHVILLGIATVTCSMLALTSCTAQQPPAIDDAALRMGPPFYSGSVMPEPREARFTDDIALLVDGPAGRRHYALEILPDHPVEELMRRLWAQRVGAYEQQFADIEAPVEGDDVLPVVFLRPDDPGAAQWLERSGIDTRADDLPAQGYRLEIRPDLVLCVAPDPSGLVNGLASLLQLVHVDDDGALVARGAEIADQPTFEIRYTAEYFLPGESFFDWMMLHKINGFGACYPGMRWNGNTEEKREALRAIGEYIDRYETMHFMVQFHIGGRGGHRPVDGGDPEDMEQLLATVRETMHLARPQHVMICYDDVTPELQPREQELFERPALAHEAIMQQVYDAVKEIDAETVVSFCSPYYQGRHHRRWRDTNPNLEETLQYMEDLRGWSNRDIRIVWTGPVTESRLIEMEDIEHYLGLVGEDRELMYWDNTWHYHQPLRNFHARYLEGFVDYCADSTSYINIFGTQAIGRFFSVTANDYYWNPDAFDAERSWRNAVTQFMGPAAVPVAEEFYELRGDAYFVFFKRDVDLAALKDVLDRLADVSLTPEIPAHCLHVYETIKEERAAAE